MTAVLRTPGRHGDPRPARAVAAAGLTALLLLAGPASSQEPVPAEPERSAPAGEAPNLPDAPLPDAPLPDAPLPDEAEAGGVWTIQFENDVFYNVDRHYTNGVRVSYAAPRGEVPWIVRDALSWTGLFPLGVQWHTVYTVGQSIYTPRDITDPTPDPDDRPYAGWLYGAIGVVAETEIDRTLAELSLGVVGPASLAEQTQEFVHEVLGADDPQGWGTQLDNEPAVLLTLQRSWRLVRTDWRGFELDFTPQATVALGNVFTFASGGGIVRVGRNMPDDWGPPQIRPSNAGSAYFEADGFGWYLFAGAAARGVAQNIFLDGNSFQDGPSVDRNPFVGDLQAGVVVAWDNVRLGYTHVLRTDEFENQDESDLYGGISLSVRF